MPDLANRRSALEMSPEEFRAAGHALVDQLADFWADPRNRPVTTGDDPAEIWKLLGKGPLPEDGTPANEVLQDAYEKLAKASLLNGHPKFFGYITAGAAPIGVLADMLASGINPNCGGWPLSPVASAIEIQTVQWIAELIGYPSDCGGALCSGGNVANMLGFWAARGPHYRQSGVGAEKLRVYASAATHTWIEKAADLSGLGADSVRMIAIDGEERMSLDALRSAIALDIEQGAKPFLVVASGGTVSTGAVDDLTAVRALCDEFGLWMHVDGAYGAFAACLPEASAELKALSLADSVALDPHKWLYAPLEAGCVLVRDRSLLLEAFSYRPPYYQFHREDSPEWCNFYELGIQNSRGFRALKVWAALRQAGRNGYVQSIRDDVALTQAMADYAAQQPEIEVRSCRLSIVTFRYRPLSPLGSAASVPGNPGADPRQDEYSNSSNAHSREELNLLNQRILAEMQNGGEAFVSNAVIDGDYLLRACIVNFRTRLSDVTETIDLVVRLGRKLSAERQLNA